DVYGIAAPQLPTYRIALKIQRFDSALGAYARIDALWSIRRSGGGDDDRVTCASTISESVTPGYAELADGHQRAIAAIAAAIAGSIRNAQQNHAALACPAKT
ncbi:MAG: ABC-type transport auxiliary lipoprotein family protein, partial [Stenotrophobium sp.]